MKKVLLLLIFAVVTSFSLPRKIFYPYAIAIFESELIIDGTISNVSPDEYEFEICDFVKGKSLSHVNIKIWEEWSCDGRVGKIEKGQRLLLFLKRDDASNNCFHTFNGSTGELFVSNNESVKTFMTKSFSKVEELKKGIKMFQSAYTYKKTTGQKINYGFRNHFKKLKSTNEINQMKTENKFFKFIVEKELRHYDFK
jgi:hypothetical protein